MAEKLLDVRDLTIGLKGEKSGPALVSKATFSVSESQVVGLVGESGSGKSITSLAIMKLLPPQLETCGGSIFFSGEGAVPKDLLQYPEKKMQQLRGRKISMIFQEPMTSLNPAYTCGEQIRESIRRHLGLDQRRANQLALEWMVRVKLPRPERLIKAYPHQLSGGQRQRVMIAMAMCCNPALLIADEPTTALDVTVQRAVLELMLELQQQYKMGILFITHDLGVINEIADEVVVMNRGHIVEQGVVKKVLEAPVHPYTKGLLGCRPPIDKRLSSLPVMKDFFNQETGEDLSLFRSPEELIRERAIGEAAQQARKKILYGTPPILEVKDLQTRFIVKTNFFGRPVAYYDAVRAVNFRLFRGETLGLVGESGCGKTTLGRSILQLVGGSTGEIFYQGKRLDMNGAAARKAFRKKIQIIFQDPYSSLNPRMTVGQILMEPMLVHRTEKGQKARESKAKELLEQVGLPAASFAKYPHQFSGGQRQRIGIARALALEPEIIICDESVSALDMSVQAQVLNLLNRLKKEFGLTYLFISHDLSVVKYMSDRIMVMKDGKIEEEGDADKVFVHPQSPYTRQLIASIPGIR